MLWLLLLAAGLWGLGHLLGMPTRHRLLLLLGLYLAVLLGLLLQPDVLGSALGLTRTGWLVFGGTGLLIWGYARGLKMLRARAAPAPEAPKGAFSRTELSRYARQIVLREIGGPGQRRLKEARVLVIGAGGLGAPALQYLGAAGVGTIGIVDDDVVDNSNLARQVIHKDAAIGMPKVFSAEAELKAQNPNIKIHPYNQRLSAENAPALFADYDLILDGTDNFATRYLINETAVATGRPLVSGALSQWEGQIALFHPKSGGPCYQCIFPTAPAPGLAPSCAEAGVLGPLPGVIGSMMAAEAIKWITQAGEPLKDRMLIYDALYAESRTMRLKPRTDCPICAEHTPQ